MACTPLFTFSPTPDSTRGTPTVPVPSGIVNGQVVVLSGGTDYSGTLIIAGLSNVVISISATPAATATTISPLTGQNAISADNSLSCRIDGGGIAGANAAGLIIRGAPNVGISANNSSGITVTRVAVFGCSSAGIELKSTNFNTINRCYVNSCSALVAGIGGGTMNNSFITECTVTEIHQGNTSRGIYIEAGSSNDVSSNLVKSCTYHGISYLKPVNGRINCNSVDNCPKGADGDSGGIYTQFITNTVTANAIISSNTVTNITNGGAGIYLDDLSNGITLQRNTISSCTIAMTLHRAYDVNILSNSCVAFTSKGINFSGATGEIHSVTVTYNVFRANLQVGEWVFAMEVGTDMVSAPWAFFDNNYYFSNPTLFGRTWTGGAAAVDYTYAEWKTHFNSDANSTYNVTVGSRVVTDLTSGGPTNSGFILSRNLRKLFFK